MKNKYISITVCIINYNSSEFILNTLYCLEKLTKNTYKVIIRDNNSNIKDYLKLKKKIQEYSNVELYRIENFNYTGSLAHGIAINDLINRIDTKYGLILDADCTFLYKEWDEILINELNENCPIIGTQAALGYGSKKYDDFPLSYAILFYTEIFKELQLDFTPINPQEFRDVGYELRNKFLEKGYKGKLLYGKNTRDFQSGPFHKIICTEYYLNGIDVIFNCHFGRGSTLGAAKYIKKKRKNKTKGHVKLAYIIPVLGKYLLKLKGKNQKKKWIRICKAIVDNQIS